MWFSVTPTCWERRPCCASIVTTGRAMAQTEPTTASPATASPTPLRIAVLTVGTRGDVQPFVALGHHMQRRGHTVMICTSSDFKPFVESACWARGEWQLKAFHQWFQCEWCLFPFGSIALGCVAWEVSY